MWNEAALVASKEIILCESLIDALTFWCAGFRNVTTSYGVNGFTEEHRAAFQKHGTKRIYIAYDRDEAGEKAAAKHAEELMAMGIECFRVQFPKGHGCERVRVEDAASGESLGRVLEQCGMAGQRQAAHSRERSSEVEAAMIEEPEPEPSEQKQEPTTQSQPQKTAPPKTKSNPQRKKKMQSLPPTGAGRRESFFFSCCRSDARAGRSRAAAPMPQSCRPIRRSKGRRRGNHSDHGRRARYRVLGLEES